MAQRATREAENLSGDQFQSAPDVLVVNPLKEFEQPRLMRGRELINTGEDERAAHGLSNHRKGGKSGFGLGAVGNNPSGVFKPNQPRGGPGKNGELGSNPKSWRARA